MSHAPFTAHHAPCNMTHAPSTIQGRDLLHTACGMRCAPCIAQRVECRRATCGTPYSVLVTEWQYPLHHLLEFKHEAFAPSFVGSFPNTQWHACKTCGHQIDNKTCLMSIDMMPMACCMMLTGDMTSEACDHRDSERHARQTRET